MEHMPSLTITAVVSLLLATDLPFPVEMTALMMVGLVLRFMLKRDARSHDDHDRRLVQIESLLNDERGLKDEQRMLKHALRNEITAIRATIAMLVPVAQRCSCGSMDQLIPILERLALDTKEPT